MTNNVTTVTVRNRLGNQYGNLDVQVNTWANQQNTGNLTISAGDEKMVYPLPAAYKSSLPPQLDSIDIEVSEVTNGIHIPIKIYPYGLNVVVSHAILQNKWTIIFEPLITEGTGTKGGDSNVNVTIGQDEPMELFAFLAVVTAIGLFAGPLLYGISPVLWGAAVGVTFVGAVAAWYKSAVKKQKKRKRTLENR